MVFDFLFKRKPAALPFSTDIHCHIVPGVDDGAPDAEISGQLLERMAAIGFKRIFASPHVTMDTFENTPEKLKAPFESLQAEKERRGIDVELHHHAEYRLDDFFLQQRKAGNLKPLPGNHLLVENSFSHEPYDLDSVLFELKMDGFNPILAHPERYMYYVQNYPERYSELHDSGVMFQINLLSLAGRYGRTVRAMALELLEEGMVDFIGSDIHRASHVSLIEEYMQSRNFRHDLKLMSNLKNDEI